MLSIHDANIVSNNFDAVLKYALNFCDTVTFWGEDYHELTLKKIFGKNLRLIFLSNEYMSISCGVKTKVFHIDYNDFVSQILSCANDLFAWQLPFYPEDLCLFSKGKCWLETIAHEKLGYIYDDSEETKEFLRSIGVEFDEYPPVDDSDIPRLPE